MGRTMLVNNPPKFWLLVLAMAGTFVLMALGTLNADQGLPIITAIVGYGIGNGIAAKNGEPVQPVFGPKGDHPGTWLQAPDGSWVYMTQPPAPKPEG